MERTLVLIKPDALQRALAGEVIKRFEQRGLKIIGAKMIRVDEEFAHKHYFDLAERRGPEVLKRMTNALISGPVIAMVFEGINAVKVVRKTTGDTEPTSASPGTIRGDLAHHTFTHADNRDIAIQNIVHASSNLEEAKQEIELWFEEKELHSYTRSDERFVF